MMCSETLQLPMNQNFPVCEHPEIERGPWMRYIARGGMPGFCFIRDDQERAEQIKAWLDTTVHRDLALIPKMKLNPDLAMSIMTAIARLNEPTAGNIARWVRRDPRVVNTHLAALSLLFAVHRLDPHRFGTGKSIYFLCDVVFASYLGANFERQLTTAILNQLLSKNEYLLNGAARLTFYRTTKGSLVHFIIEEQSQKLTAIKLLMDEKIDLRELEVLNALAKKNSDQPMTLTALGPTKEKIKVKEISIYPWESVC